MVESEEIAKLVGILFGVFEILDQPQLALDQALAAPGQVDEHRVDVASQLGLFDRQSYRLRVDGVERARDLADLVGRRDRHQLDADITGPAVA
ncbi:MAG TPA: hypothetical protein VGJ44_17005, partial [Kribbellaceae bacterium]